MTKILYAFFTSSVCAIHFIIIMILVLFIITLLLVVKCMNKDCVCCIVFPISSVTLKLGFYVSEGAIYNEYKTMEMKIYVAVEITKI